MKMCSFDGVMGFSGGTSPFPIKYISRNPFVKSHFNFDLTIFVLGRQANLKELLESKELAT